MFADSLEYSTAREITIDSKTYYYHGVVKLSFIAYDDTFKLEGQDYGVMKEIYVHIIVTKPE